MTHVTLTATTTITTTTVSAHGLAHSADWGAIRAPKVYRVYDLYIKVSKYMPILYIVDNYIKMVKKKDGTGVVNCSIAKETSQDREAKVREIDAQPIDEGP